MKLKANSSCYIYFNQINLLLPIELLTYSYAVNELESS